MKESNKEWQIFDKVTSEGSVTMMLLYGPPGTGKTSKACKTVDKKGYYNITLNEESSVSEILGMWIPKGKEFVWSDGVGIRAWKEGKLLVINEIDKASGSVLTQLHALLDERHMARLTIPSGETVRPKAKFKVIATMNGNVQDIPEALADRFELKLNITKPHQDLINLLPNDLHGLVDSAYSKDTLSISFREILSFSKLRETLGDDAYMVFGKLAGDVKAALSLGKREVTEDELVTDETEVEHGGLDEITRRRSKRIATRRFNSYWEETDYEDLNRLEVASHAKCIIGTLDEEFKRLMENAFKVQKLHPVEFETYADILYNKIVSS